MNTALVALATTIALLSPNQSMSQNTQSTNAAVDTNRDDIIVEMSTSMGNVKLLLYGDTPKHMANFVKLVNEGFYDGVLFHRVINEFMVQTGDPDSKDAPAGAMLGSGGPDYTIEAEFVYPRHFHRRGALAAARQGDAANPTKASSASQFYIVTGKTYTPEQLDRQDTARVQRQQQAVFTRLANENRDTIMAMRRAGDTKGLEELQSELIARMQDEVMAAPDLLTPEQREAYSTVGGTPHLDGSYTVFGEVLEGMDVIDRIQKVETDPRDRPVEDIRILTMKVVGPSK